MRAASRTARGRIKNVVLALALRHEEALIVARGRNDVGTLERQYAQHALRGQGIAQANAPGAPLLAAGDEHVATAIEQGIGHAMRMQDLHARSQNRQLGDATQIDGHSGPRKARGPGVRVQNESTVADQAPLGSDLGGIGQVLLIPKPPSAQRAYGDVKSALGGRRQRLRVAQHCHHFGRHGNRMQTGRAVDGADHAALVVARHHARQALHFGPGRVHGAIGVARRSVPAADHHVNTRSHQGPRAALQGRCGARGHGGSGPLRGAEQRHSHDDAPPRHGQAGAGSLHGSFP